MAQRPMARPRAHALEAIFGQRRCLIGVIHAPALPGAPAYEGASIEDICSLAVDEGAKYRDAGFDAVIVENHGDIPFLKPDAIGPETAAVMAVMANQVRREVGLPVGINVLANGATTAMAVAKAAGAAFIRVNQWANAYVANEGIIEGDAARVTRYRAWLQARDVRVFADAHVKHGAHAIVADRSIEELTRDVEFFDADVVIATGQRTGDPPTPDEIRTIKAATSLPVVVGSGVSVGNIGAVLSVADGVIVASSLKRDGVWWNALDPDRLEAFRREVARVA